MLVGVIGLSGAVVGAAAAFAGVVYQQKQQVKLARSERRDAMALQAVDTLIAELEKVRELAWSVPYEEQDEDPPGFVEALEGHLSVIRLAVLRLPDRELREAIEAACVMGFGHESSFREYVGLRVQRGVMSATLGDAQMCLGAYLRQEPRPHTTFLFQARDYYHSMISAPRGSSGRPGA